MVTQRQPWHIVKPSKLHGNGVFAQRDIPQGTRILQYAGKRLTPEQADARFPVNPDEPFHTFFFALSNGKIIDGGQGGNDSRWINHSCAPNCEGHENEDGSRVFIVAMRDIAAGEELLYDYSLVIDEEITEELKQNYGCLCGAPQCRSTMIALQPAQERAQAVAEELREVAAELDAEMEQARAAPVTGKAKQATNLDRAEDPQAQHDTHKSGQEASAETDSEQQIEKGKKGKKDKKKKKDKAKNKGKNKDKKAIKKDKEGKKAKKGRKKE